MTGEGEPTRAVEESADHVADRPSFWRELPILGHVPAGRPSMPPNDDLVEGYFSVPRGTVTDPQAFCLRVDGDSMTGVVERGDLVVVSPGARDRVRSRDLVVAMLDDGATVRVYSTAGSRVVLSSANPRYPPVVVDRESGAEIVGKVVGIYHYCR
jgi:repressor LexA